MFGVCLLIPREADFAQRTKKGTGSVSGACPLFCEPDMTAIVEDATLYSSSSDGVRQNAWLNKNALRQKVKLSLNLAVGHEKYEPSGNRINGVVITFTEMSFARTVEAETNVQVVSAKKGNRK